MYLKEFHCAIYTYFPQGRDGMKGDDGDPGIPGRMGEPGPPVSAT